MLCTNFPSVHSSTVHVYHNNTTLYPDKKDTSDKSPKSEKAMFFRFGLACSTSNQSLEQKTPSCWKILQSRPNDIAVNYVNVLGV